MFDPVDCYEMASVWRLRRIKLPAIVNALEECARDFDAILADLAPTENAQQRDVSDILEYSTYCRDTASWIHEVIIPALKHMDNGVMNAKVEAL